jgi:hypothetical protein
MHMASNRVVSIVRVRVCSVNLQVTRSESIIYRNAALSRYHLLPHTPLFANLVLDPQARPHYSVQHRRRTPSRNNRQDH